jgi:hypothetical protein
MEYRTLITSHSYYCQQKYFFFSFNSYMTINGHKFSNSISDWLLCQWYCHKLIRPLLAHVFLNFEMSFVLNIFRKLVLNFYSICKHLLMRICQSKYFCVIVPQISSHALPKRFFLFHLFKLAFIKFGNAANNTTEAE